MPGEGVMPEPGFLKSVMKDLKKFLHGISLFNSRDFFDAHEIWEDVWRVEDNIDDRILLQGLIQAATSLHHFERRNFKGARQLYDSGRRLLEKIPPHQQRLALTEFLGSWENLMASLLRYPVESLPGRNDAQKDTFPVFASPDLFPRLRQEMNP